MTTDVHARRRVILALAAYCGFTLILPLIHVPTGQLFGAIRHGSSNAHLLAALAFLALVAVPTALFMLLQLWLSRALVGLKTSPLVSVLLLLAFTALWFAILVIHVPRHQIAPALLKILGSNLAITLACTYLGLSLSRIVREANILLPVALIAMPIDYIGAMTTVGFTHDVVTKHPSIVRAVSVSVPAIGGLHPLSFIGPGDVLFMAFFFAVVLRLEMNDRATFWWMYGLLTVAMLLVLLFPINIAALVPMGLAVLIANARFFRLQRSEAFAVLYAALMVLVLVVGFFAYSHTHIFRH